MQHRNQFGTSPSFQSELKINNPQSSGLVLNSRSVVYQYGSASFSLDGLTYNLASQQCGVLAHNLAEVVMLSAKASGSEAHRRAAMGLSNYQLWYELIELRTTSEKDDLHAGYKIRRESNEYNFTGSFRSLSEQPNLQSYYEVEVGADLVSNQAVLTMDGSMFRLDIAQACRLAEQLWIAGYLKAQAESTFECSESEFVAQTKDPLWQDNNSNRQSVGSAVFENIRHFEWHGYGLSGKFTAAVKFSSRDVMVSMDDSQYHFSATQCAEISKNIALLLATNYELGFLQLDVATHTLLAASLEWHRVIHDSVGSDGAQAMNIFSGLARGYEFIASADFERSTPSERGSLYHRVLIAVDEDVGLPCMSIDGRSFAMSIEETLWLMESLQIAGYLAAMAD